MLSFIYKEDVLNFVCVLDIFLMIVRKLCSSISCEIVTVSFLGGLTALSKQTQAYTTTKASSPQKVLTHDIGKKTVSQTN